MQVGFHQKKTYLDSFTLPSRPMHMDVLFVKWNMRVNQHVCSYYAYGIKYISFYRHHRSGQNTKDEVVLSSLLWLVNQSSSIRIDTLNFTILSLRNSAIFSSMQATWASYQPRRDKKSWASKEIWDSMSNSLNNL